MSIKKKKLKSFIKSIVCSNINLTEAIILYTYTCFCEENIKKVLSKCCTLKSNHLGDKFLNRFLNIVIYGEINLYLLDKLKYIYLMLYTMFMLYLCLEIMFA